VTQRSELDNGGPSVTARRVAAYRLGFTRVPAPYGDPAGDEALAADVAAGEAPSGRMREHLQTRTRFFDREVAGAISRGVRQIVIGAAGYDGRALRYAKPGVHWFEVDHPATQRDKRERLERLGIAVDQVRFVEADFTRDPIAERLTAAGLDPARRSLFLLEGVAVYLEPAVLERVLAEFRQVARAGSRLAISVSTSTAQPEARARLHATLAALGEPARNTLEAGQAAELLARTGWHTTASEARLRAAGLLLASAGPAPSTAPATRRPGKTEPADQPTGPLPLSALLSQALVALTIEIDNEAEHRLPHRTTNYGARGDGPWLTSLAMFENCLRFVTDQPITVGELEILARTGTNLDGMRRWGYITIDGTSKKTRKTRPGPGAVLRATARGLRARETWLPLPGLIEQRWRERYGAEPIGRLRHRLEDIAAQIDPGLPDTLPILGHTLVSRGPDPALPPRPGEPGEPGVTALPLSALLSRVLLAFALDYERESEQSLAIGANLLRVLGPGPTRLRDLPPLTGLSKEAVAWAMGALLRGRLAVEEPDPAASRGRIARLTERGRRAQRLHLELLGTVEDRWRERFGRDTLGALRECLEALATGTEGQPPLFRALEPYPDNWRAAVPSPRTLPYYPMVLHRGGYPDGS
jgi:methyltransferase (TIGR00027 family)